MAETYIQVSPDGSGKKVAANTDADGNYRQVIEIGDGAGADLFAVVTAAGALKTDASASTQPVSGTVTADQGGAPWSVNVPTGTPTVGQAKIAIGGTAVQIHSVSVALAQGVALVADAGNAGKITVGPSGVTATADGTGNGYVLSPGQPSPVLPYSNINLVYINGANVGDFVSFVGI